MTKLFYISSMRMNSIISDTVVTGHHISVDGLTYELVTRRPKNKRVLRKLVNISKQEHITIYG